MFKPYTYYDMLRDALKFKDFESEQGVLDYILIPWYLLRWIFALIWTQLWGGWRWLYWFNDRENRRYAFHAWGRHDSPEPVICSRCLWAGPTRWLYHDYCDGGDGDSEACDSCPRCGGEL